MTTVLEWLRRALLRDDFVGTLAELFTGLGKRFLNDLQFLEFLLILAEKNEPQDKGACDVEGQAEW